MVERGVGLPESQAGFDGAPSVGDVENPVASVPEAIEPPQAIQPIIEVPLPVTPVETRPTSITLPDIKAVADGQEADPEALQAAFEQQFTRERDDAA